MRDKITEILNLIKINKFKEALIKCDDLKKHFDKNVEFLHIYGFVFYNLNNYEKAIDQWEKAIKIDADNKEYTDYKSALLKESSNSKDELKSESMLKRIIDKYDLNNDGELSSEERRNAFETMPTREINEAIKFFMENRRN